MTPDQLVAHCPTLFHLTPSTHVESIRRHGLLSTAALLARFGVGDEERERLVATRRAKSITLMHREWGSVQLRDQHPLSARGLERALGGTMTVAAWLRLINERVFLFPDRDRLDRLAVAYRHEAQSVLHIDTRRLLELHADDVEVSHMNTGATAPFAHPRGPETFRPLREYPYEERRRRLGRRDALAEVTVRWAIPDVEACLIGVESLRV